MSHDGTIRKSAYNALKAQGFGFVWRSITKGAYDPDSLTYGADVVIDHEVVGAVYSNISSQPGSAGKPTAETTDKGASAVHSEDVEAAFPVPPAGLEFVPSVGDLILWGGNSWRVAWIVPIKGVASVVAYQVGAAHG